MGTDHTLVFLGLPRRMDLVLLAFTWLAGFLSGLLFSLQPGMDAVISRFSMITRLTIPGLMCILLFPLALSCIAVFKPQIFYLLSFLKALCFGYCSGCVLLMCVGAGWLVKFMLLFSDMLYHPCLFWFWIQHADGNREHLREHIVICLCIAIFIGLLDYFLVSPFLAMLLDL